MAVLSAYTSDRHRMKAGDVVTRAYQLSIFHNLLGLVIGRDNCGYLTVIWGDKVEHMWDDNDLIVISSIDDQDI